MQMRRSSTHLGRVECKQTSFAGVEKDLQCTVGQQIPLLVKLSNLFVRQSHEQRVAVAEKRLLLQWHQQSTNQSINQREHCFVVAAVIKKTQSANSRTTAGTEKFSAAARRSRRMILKRQCQAMHSRSWRRNRKGSTTVLPILEILKDRR